MNNNWMKHMYLWRLYSVEALRIIASEVWNVSSFDWMLVWDLRAKEDQTKMLQSRSPLKLQTFYLIVTTFPVYRLMA